MRDIGEKIIEAEKLHSNVISDLTKDSIDKSIIECFKRGLKPEIEQRITKEKIEDIIKEAIALENTIEARNALRREYKLEKSTIRKNINICQICKSNDHDSFNCKTFEQIVCKFCNKSGHSEDRCFAKNKNMPECQLCNRRGHTAIQCSLIKKCQICNKIGHLAKDCNQAYSAVCQLCNKIGHSAKECFKRNNKGLETRSQMMCQICEKTGHTAAGCKTNQGNTMIRPSLKECAYCKNKGHEITECRKLQFKNSGNNYNNYKNQYKTGNESSSRNMGAAQGTQNSMHPRDQKECNNIIAELIPSV